MWKFFLQKTKQTNKQTQDPDDLPHAAGTDKSNLSQIPPQIPPTRSMWQV